MKIGQSNQLSKVIDGATDEGKLCGLFKVKYEKLYKTVSYVKGEMHDIVTSLTRGIERESSSSR